MRFGAGQRSSVDIASMAHVKDGNHPTTVVYLVDHPVVADPDAPPVRVRDRLGGLGIGWSGVAVSFPSPVLGVP